MPLVNYPCVSRACARVMLVVSPTAVHPHAGKRILSQSRRATMEVSSLRVAVNASLDSRVLDVSRHCVTIVAQKLDFVRL